MTTRLRPLATPTRRICLALVSSAVVALCLTSARAAFATTHKPDRPLGTLARCRLYGGLPAGFGTDPHAGMVHLRGGSYLQGSAQGYADERPPRLRTVEPFWIDRTEVTNAQFLAFVQATGYVTTAEREDFAAVFHQPTEAELEQDRYAFWRITRGANFRHPEGPDSQIVGRENLPVVQVTLEDASAYASWLGRALPSEAEWEYAARAGRDDLALHKAPRDAQGRALANFWQGDFPLENSGEDGFARQAPVGCYAPNPFGLYDAIGNVWEWTADLYTDSHADSIPSAPPTDCRPGESADAGAKKVLSHVIKGGSFLCAANFCARYRVSARHPQEPNMSAQHLGFRTIKR